MIPNDWSEHKRRHLLLAGAHAVSGEGTFIRGDTHRTTPAEVPQHVAEARARLIAADRDLLRACKLALDYLEPEHNNGHTAEWTNKMIASVKSAITKATGGE